MTITVTATTVYNATNDAWTGQNDPEQIAITFKDGNTMSAADAQTYADNLIAGNPAQITALQAQITALQGQLDSANTALAAEKQKLTDLEAKIQADIAAVVP